jgi:hypothetical protein
MHYFINGSFKEIGQTQVFGTFKKREFVLTTEEQFPQSIKMEVINENVEVLDRYSVGEVVTVAFVLNGNEHQGRHFVNIRAIAVCEVIDGRVEKEFKKAKVQNKAVQKFIEELRNANKIAV